MGESPRVYAMLAGVILFWGLAFAAIRFVTLEGLSWVSLTVLRFTAGSAIFAALLAVKKDARVPLAREDRLPLLALGFLGFTGYHSFLNYGEAMGAPSGSAALIIAVAPAFIVVLAVLRLKEKLSTVRAAGLGIAFTGLAVTVLLHTGRGLQVGLSPAVAAVVPAAVMAAFYTVYGKTYLKKYPPIAYVAYTMFAGTALMLPLALWYGPGTVTEIFRLSPAGWAAFAFLAVFPTVVAYVLWFRVLDRIPASRAAPYIYLSTLIALSAGLLLEEAITASVALGAAMVIGGVYLAQRTGRGGESGKMSVRIPPRGE